MVNPSYDTKQITQAMETLLASSPNAAEPLFKYRNKESKDVVKEIRVRWGKGNSKQWFPKETILTEENREPVLRMMAVGVGKDVFDVKVESQQVAEAKK